jgi:predicted ribosome quality control (RQC) complex YloA/Tae2 family protein
VPKIKTYRSSSGLDIIVGQDDESNDHLTFFVAHQNDIWLHVSGTPGSHVILRCGESGIEPDKDSLKEAAGLAAWFSKMRNGRNVAVSYCLARNVHKPRRAKPGSVTISGAKKIKVQPMLMSEVHE